MEIPEEKIVTALKMYEDELVSSKCLGKVPEGYMHASKASTIRGIGLQLGVFNDKMISDAVRRANYRFNKTQREKK